jgi:hypothetical protein
MSANIPNQEAWTADAALAIRLCESWTADVAPTVNCKFYLFGSAIYRGGEQFNPIASDLDIVCELPQNGDALARAKTIRLLYDAKQRLELSTLAALRRTCCTEPAVSLVVVTPLEIEVNIHKSATRTFFDRNIFYDLQNKAPTLGPMSGGTRIIRDEGLRQALEYVQRVRNDYLSVCANATGGLIEYSGPDPMPKQLLRSAAQIIPGAAEGEWYDTRQGLEEMDALLRARRAEDATWKSLFDKISVRRGGRGRPTNLTAEDQLLLAELLYDKVANAVHPEALSNWAIRVTNPPPTREHLSGLFQSVLRIVPHARQIGVSPGGDVLTVQSSETGRRLIAQLFELRVLPNLLDVDVADVGPTEDLERNSPLEESSREALLMQNISEWTPHEHMSVAAEQEFSDYLLRVLQEEPRLRGAEVLRQAPFAGVEVPFKIDFLLRWPSDLRGVERIGIEFVWLQSRSTFYYKVSQVLPLGRTVLLVIYGSDQVLEQLRPEIARLGQMNGNIKVVTIS